MHFGCLCKCSTPHSADVDDSQEKPTSDSCKVDSGSIETSSAPTMHQPHVGEPQLGVATVDAEEPLCGRSSFQDKCVNGERRGKPGQESFPEGRGGGYAKLDNVTRGTADVSSVWDSFDVSAIRESQESLPGEFVHLSEARIIVDLKLSSDPTFSKFVVLSCFS